jgi:hypothetical protein
MSIDEQCYCVVSYPFDDDQSIHIIFVDDAIATLEASKINLKLCFMLYFLLALELRYYVNE